MNVVNIKTDGTLGDGVVAAGYLGQAAILKCDFESFLTRSRQEAASACKTAAYSNNQ